MSCIKALFEVVLEADKKVVEMEVEVEKERVGIGLAFLPLGIAGLVNPAPA